MKRRRFISAGEEIEAEVFGYEKHMNGKWTYVYAYTPPGRSRIIAEENVYQSDKDRKRMQIGEKVTLVYDPLEPTKFVRKHLYGSMIAWGVMFVMGCVYIAVGIILLQ